MLIITVPEGREYPKLSKHALYPLNTSYCLAKLPINASKINCEKRIYGAWKIPGKWIFLLLKMLKKTTKNQITTLCVYGEFKKAGTPKFLALITAHWNTREIIILHALFVYVSVFLSFFVEHGPHIHRLTVWPIYHEIRTHCIYYCAIRP